MVRKTRPLTFYLKLQDVWAISSDLFGEFVLAPFPVIVTTRIVTFLVGDPYKPSFATITGKGDNPRYHQIKGPRFTQATLQLRWHRKKHMTDSDGTGWYTEGMKIFRRLAQIHRGNFTHQKGRWVVPSLKLT